jgi:HAMP domain-containing protein
MEKSKLNAARRIELALLVVGAGYLVKYQVAATHSPYWIGAGWLLTAWLAWRVARALVRGWRRVRAHSAAGVNLDTLDALTTDAMQPWLRGYYAVEKRMYRGFWRTLTRAPLAPRDGFSMRRGRNGARLVEAGLAALVLVSAVASLPVLYFASPFWPRLSMLAAIAALALYAAIWLIGERRAIAESAHAVSAQTVSIELGVRCVATLALDAIADCRLLDESVESYRARGGIGAAEIWVVAPSEPPNVVLELARLTTLDVLAFGYPRVLRKRVIALYLDQPAAFVAAVQAGRAPERAGHRAQV